MKMLVWCLLVAAAGCGLNTVKVEPVTVQPIHVTIDVNVHDTTRDTATVQHTGAAKR